MHYKMTADYHIHTEDSRFWHGKGEIEDCLRNALLGRRFTEIGITDHGYKFRLYGIDKKEETFIRIRYTIDSLNYEYQHENIKILFGLECNIIDLDGNIDVKDYMVKYLDFVNASYHIGTGLGILHRSKYNLVTDSEKDKLAEGMINAINKNPIMILTHPTEIIKFDTPHLLAIGKTAKKRGTVLEISSKHEPIEKESLELLHRLGVKFVLGSDAHVPERVGDFSKAKERALEANIPATSIVNSSEGIKLWKKRLIKDGK